MAKKYLVVRMSWDGQCETAEDDAKRMEEVNSGATSGRFGGSRESNLPRPKRHLNELAAEGWEVDRVLMWAITTSDRDGDRHSDAPANGYLLLSMENEDSKSRKVAGWS